MRASSAPASDERGHLGLTLEARVEETAPTARGELYTRHPGMVAIGRRLLTLRTTSASTTELTSLDLDADSPASRQLLDYVAKFVRTDGRRIFVTGCYDRSRPCWVAALDAASGPVLHELGRAEIRYPMLLELGGDRLVGVTEYNEISVRDTTDPAAMLELEPFAVEYEFHDLAVTGQGYAYLAHLNGLEIVDVRNPEAPRKVGRMSGFELPRGVRVSDDGRHLVVFEPIWVGQIVEGRVHVYALDDPVRPRLIGEVTIPSLFGDVESLARDDPILFDLEGDRFWVAAQQIVAVDLSDPTQPLLVLRQTLPARALGLSIGGDTVFVAEPGGSVAAFRVGVLAHAITLPVVSTNRRDGP